MWCSSRSISCSSAPVPRRTLKSSELVPGFTDNVKATVEFNPPDFVVRTVATLTPF